MRERRTRYELAVHYDVTPEDDIDIVEEGTLRRERFHSAADALSELGGFMARNGGPEMWDQPDAYGVRSCWLHHEEGTDISYQASLARVTETVDWDRARFTSERQLLPIPWGRINAASGGGLGDAQPSWTTPEPPDEGGEL